MMAESWRQWGLKNRFLSNNKIIGRSYLMDRGLEKSILKKENLNHNTIILMQNTGMKCNKEKCSFVRDY